MHFPTIHLDAFQLPHFGQACLAMTIDAVAYNLPCLIAAIAARIIGSPAALPLLVCAAVATTAVAAVRLCRHYRIFTFESFTLQCYDFVKKYHHLRFVVALIFLVVGHLWPLLGVVGAVPLGILYGVFLEIDLQRWRQSSSSSHA